MGKEEEKAWMESPNPLASNWFQISWFPTQWQKATQVGAFLPNSTGRNLERSPPALRGPESWPRKSLYPRSPEFLHPPPKCTRRPRKALFAPTDGRSKNQVGDPLASGAQGAGPGKHPPPYGPISPTFHSTAVGLRKSIPPAWAAPAEIKHEPQQHHWAK